MSSQWLAIDASLLSQKKEPDRVWNSTPCTELHPVHGTPPRAHANLQNSFAQIERGNLKLVSVLREHLPIQHFAA